MSSCIFIHCEKCGRVEQVNTEGQGADGFNNNAWEGGFIDTLCEECEGEK